MHAPIYSRPVSSRALLGILLSLPLLMSACSETAQDSSAQKKILVSAAASLRNAFSDVAVAFEKRDSTIKVELNFAGSNLLARQLSQGAPVDVFAPAAEEIMDSLAQAGEIDATTRKDFATNRLVIVAHRDSSDTLASLAQLAQYNHIAIAAPGVPARIYIEEALRNAGLWDQLATHFVYGGDVRQVLEYVVNGDSPIGCVYESDAAQFATHVRIIHVVDPKLYRKIAYPIAAMKNARAPEGARAFINYLLGDTGKAILARHGFAVK